VKKKLKNHICGFCGKLGHRYKQARFEDGHCIGVIRWCVNLPINEIYLKHKLIGKIQLEDLA